MNTQNFYVTTADIWSNEWSDPIYFEFEGIDPSFFFEEDGRTYIQGSWHSGPLSSPCTSIRQFEVELATGKALSETKTIWTGHLGKNDSEGPHIYKKDGYYYLLTAEGGTWQHHCITMARSTDIWGPYETYTANPVLTADGKDEYIQYTGHGELFQDGKGNWWAVHLAIRDGEGGRSPLGRETFLTPVTWPEGGWPDIKQTQMSFEAVEAGDQTANLDSLQKNTPADADHLYLRTPHASNYTISSDGSEISLVPSHTDLSVPNGTCTFLAQRQRGLTSTASVTLVLQREKLQTDAPIKAGLSLFKDDIRHVDLFYDFQSGSISLAHTDKVEHKENPIIMSQHQAADTTTRVTFEIRASPNEYKFFAREGNSSWKGEWISCGSVDTLRMTAWDFTGTCFGIFASLTSEDAGLKVEEADAGRPEVVFEALTIV